MNRVLAAARLQVVHPRVVLGMPWLIAGTSFALNWAIWKVADLRHAAPDAFTGGILSLYITVAVVFVLAVTQLLPLAMALSLSRRDFYFGVSLFGVLSALAHGVVLAILTAVQDATGGWGAGLQFWTVGPMHVEGFGLQALVCAGPMLAFIAAGIGIGVANKRWGTNGTWGLILGVTVVLGGVALLVTWLDGWATVGSWLAGQSVLTLAVGLPAALAVVIAALSWGGLRRVVP